MTVSSVLFKHFPNNTFSTIYIFIFIFPLGAVNCRNNNEGGAHNYPGYVPITTQQPTVVSGVPSVVSGVPSVVTGVPTVVTGVPSVVSGVPSVVSGVLTKVAIPNGVPYAPPGTYFEFPDQHEYPPHYQQY